MKKYMITCLCLLSLPAAAAKEEIKLHYRYHGKHLEVPVRAPNFVDAIEPGAEKCMQFFTSEERLTLDDKIQLIDVCANPRTK